MFGATPALKQQTSDPRPRFQAKLLIINENFSSIFMKPDEGGTAKVSVLKGFTKEKWLTLLGCLKSGVGLVVTLQVETQKQHQKYINFC